MKKHGGMALVPTLVILVVITLGAVTSMQTSGIQGKMTANYRHTAEIFNETNNELSSQFNFMQKFENITEVINEFDKDGGKDFFVIKSILSNNYSESSESVVTLKGKCTTCARGFDVGVFDGIAIELRVTNKARNIYSTQYNGISVVAPSQ